MEQPTRFELCDFAKRKAAGEPITMLTAYDFPCARIADQAGVDSILVGDSLSNVVLGYPSTVPVSMDQMLHHTRAVTRAVQRSFVIGDMPFGSYNQSPEQAIANATRFLKEGRAGAVKLEGGGAMVDTAAAVVRAGIPLVGHLGLTPQTAAQLGGYRVQGRDATAAARMLQDAQRLEEAGACLLVLEMVPERLAALIAGRLRIPVIGIGAGAGVDGQVLVFHDLLGFDPGFQPRFLKRYAEVGSLMTQAIGEYCREVRARAFPSPAHVFRMEDEEFRMLLGSDGDERAK